MELNRRELELNRAAAERNTQAFERLMAAFDRFERTFDRHEKAFEQNQQAFEQVPKALDDQQEHTGDLKVFIREINQKSEKAIQALLRHGDQFMAEQAKRTEEIVAELRDSRAERRAHTDALLAVLDRLPPPAQAA
jgi:hypothetical protein